MAIAGTAAVRALIGRGLKPSATASARTKQVFARLERMGAVKVTKNGVQKAANFNQKIDAMAAREKKARQKAA